MKERRVFFNLIVTKKIRSEGELHSLEVSVQAEFSRIMYSACQFPGISPHFAVLTIIEFHMRSQIGEG